MARFRAILLAATLAAVAGLSGCAFLAGAAVGGTAAYVMHDEGYHLRSPISK